jgi:hypothetical protein
VTRAEAEEIFTTCTAIFNVLGGDLREMCKNRGVPDEYIVEFMSGAEKKKVYDKFFEMHTKSGDIDLSEEEIVEKLKNFDIEAGEDEGGQKWIAVPKGKLLNSVELNLCKTLEVQYGYKYRG